MYNKKDKVVYQKIVIQQSTSCFFICKNYNVEETAAAMLVAKLLAVM